MRMSDNKNAVVCDLRDEIMDELRREPVAVQIKTAFAVLATVLTNAALDDRQEVRRARPGNDLGSPTHRARFLAGRGADRDPLSIG